MQLEWLARLGYAARGGVFLILGYFCAAAAVASTRPLDSNDAFRALLAKPFGSVLLVILAAGLMCFAGWRAAQALMDADGCGRTLKGCCRRFSYGISAVFYLFFAGVALSIFVGLSTGNSDTAARDWVGRLLAVPFGQWVIGIAALILAGTGIGTAVAGLRAEFANRISLSPQPRRVVVALGVLGYFTRAAVFTLIGLFLFFAAIHANANEARGVAGTLRAIQSQPHGAVMLGITAAGFLAFGAYGMAEALFRRIPSDKAKARLPAWLGI